MTAVGKSKYSLRPNFVLPAGLAVALLLVGTPSAIVPTVTAEPMVVAQTTPPSPQVSQLRLRIAVLPFLLGFTNPQWNQSWDIGLGVTELIEEALFTSGRYRIVERRQLDQVLKEQGIGTSGSIDPATTARVGRVLGVQRFVTGTVNQFELTAIGGVALPGFGVGLYRTQVGLTGRVIDTNTAEIVAIVRGTGRSEGVLALAQIHNLTFGAAEFKGSVLGRALDQAIQELTSRLTAAIPQQ